MATRKLKVWTKAEQRELFNGVGICGLAWFKKKCGKRSTSSIYHKLRREYGLGGLTRGAYTLYGLEKETGYARSHIFRAGNALNQKWKRLGPRGAYLITEEQMREIIAWLSHDFWSKVNRLYKCVWCATSEKEHCSLGLCWECYYKYRKLCTQIGLPLDMNIQLYVLKKIDDWLPGKSLDMAIRAISAGVVLPKEQLIFLAKQYKELYG